MANGEWLLAIYNGSRMKRCSTIGLSFLVVCVLCFEQTINAFAPPTNSIIYEVRHHVNINVRIKQSFTANRRTTQLYDVLLHTTKSVVETAAAAAEGVVLADYAPQAADLFSNMKLPAAVVTAGMISLGFATRFPELPRDSLDKVYPLEVRQRVAKLDRLHIVLGLISVTSMLIVVLWAAVEVNQLTERSYLPAYSVWDLIHRDCDLAWAAVNTYYILGIIGFTGMLWLRAYVMLLAANASRNLMAAATSGTLAAVCLMISIVNRGVENGGGNDLDRYGESILQLFQHYVSLLLQAAMNMESPGPLQLSAILLEITSLVFMFIVLVKENETSFEEQVNEDSCPVDLFEVMNDESKIAKLSPKELEKMQTCFLLIEEEQRRQEECRINEEEGDEKQQQDSGDYSSVNVI